MSKYGAKRTIVDGITFDSKFEARCYSLLRLLERAGEIRALKLQPRFDIVVNGVKVCTYVADFEFEEQVGHGHWNHRCTPDAAPIYQPPIPQWERVVADAKGVRTKDYRIKAKLMKALYGIDVLEFVAGKMLPGQSRATLAAINNLKARSGRAARRPS